MNPKEAIAAAKIAGVIATSVTSPLPSPMDQLAKQVGGNNAAQQTTAVQGVRQTPPTSGR